MKALQYFVFTVLLLVSLAACHKKDDSVYQCHPDFPYIDTLTNQTGTLLFDEQAKTLVLRVVMNGTIDNVDIYTVCNPGTQLPAENSNVIFSGYVKSSILKGEVAGTTYYELELTQIR